MDPLASIVGGAKAVQGRFSFYVSLQLTSVLAPGICLITEVAYLAVELGGAKTGWVGRLGPLASVMLALTALSAGYVAGYVAREVGFKAIGQIERIPRYRRRLAAAAAGGLPGSLGADGLREVLALHPVLEHVAEDEPAGDGRRIGGHHHASPAYERFIYAKYWLRNHATGFGVDAVEVEINMLVATMVPIGAGALDLVAATRSHGWLTAGTAVLAVLLWLTVVDSILRLRQAERGEAVRNLCLDHLMRGAAAAYPAPPAAGGEEAPPPS